MELSFYVEIVGIIAFAIAGVLVGIEYELDIFGIFVAAIASCIAGGIIRDLTLNITPPLAFTNPVYLITSIIAAIVALIVFKVLDTKLEKRNIRKLKAAINIFDAFGLGIFTAVGCSIASLHGYGDNFFLVTFVGLITAIGGGILRDLLASRKPMVMRREIYAVAAIVGAIIFFLLNKYIGPRIALYGSAAATTLLRLIAVWRHLNLFYSIKNTDLKIDE
ncbi:MAG: trimeric intracellular cation channel family protein [Clostridia bacterium]|nr:trimeric intracellular cation channel family protein [Clostridia bacterium]